MPLSVGDKVVVEKTECGLSIRTSTLETVIETSQFLLLDGSRPMEGNLHMDSNRLTNLPEPLLDYEAATKYYVDTSAGGGGDFMADGSVPMTGNLNTGSQDIINVANIAFGNNPYLIAPAGSKFTFQALTTILLEISATLIKAYANLDMNSNKITALGAHSANGDAVRYEHVAADEHTQYLKADGTRAMTGNLNTGSQDITNVANIAFGSNPYLTTPAGSKFTFQALTTILLEISATLIKAYANLDMNSNKITALGAHSTNGDAVRYEHVAADEHTQYFRADGTRAMTANLNVGTNLIQALTSGALDSDAVNKGYVDNGDISDHNLLSNLTWSAAGHTINSSIVPIGGSLYNLGSSTYAFNDLYIDRILGSNADDDAALDIDFRGDANHRIRYNGTAANELEYKTYLRHRFMIQSTEVLNIDSDELSMETGKKVGLNGIGGGTYIKDDASGNMELHVATGKSVKIVVG